MRIAMYTSNSHFFTSGGSEVHVRELASAFVTLGLRVRVFCNSQYATEDIITSENGVDYRIIPVPRVVNSHNFFGEGLRKSSMMLFNKAMVRALLASGADIFHQHDLISNYLTTLCLAYAKYPVILTNHLGEYLLLKKHLPHVALQCFLRPYKHIIGPSRELAPEGLHSSVSTIFNGFNESIYKRDPAAREAKRKELCIKNNEVLVVVPRRWAPTKGVLYAAKAARRLAPDRPEIKWAFLCRNSPEFESYKRDIWRTLDGVPTVTTFDTQDPKELARFLNAGDVALFPSLLEAVSIAALEAMACGALVISTPVGGMGELLTSGENSVLIPERDVQAIASAVIRVSNDHDNCRSIAKEGCKLVSASYRWRSVAERTLSIYEQVLANFRGV